MRHPQRLQTRRFATGPGREECVVTKPDLASLDTLGIRFQADKSSEHHNYLAFYERFFARLRDQPIKMLEIGVFQGHSLRVWEEYFPNATITGADIDPNAARFERPRVGIEILDQSNIEDLVRVGMKHGPFDIIIEDGSHMWEHQITTLRTLFPFVRSGGIYVVEDLHTNFGSMQKDFRGVSNITCMEYLSRLVDLRVAGDQVDIGMEEDAFLRTYGRSIDCISFARGVCLIEKSQPETIPGPPATTPFIATDHDAPGVPLVLLAHLGAEGDISADTGSVYSNVKNRNIQGFSVDSPDRAVGDLLYRARLANGVWTDWVGPGAFAGTRGKGENLTGFSVRVADSSRARYSIRCAGAFRGETGNVVVGDGEDCVPRYGNGALFGMLVILHARS
jgi:hypothetical protein